jgi:hypothetical protein
MIHRADQTTAEKSRPAKNDGQYLGAKRGFLANPVGTRAVRKRERPRGAGGQRHGAASDG